MHMLRGHQILGTGLCREIVEALMRGSWPESGLHNWALPKVISGYIPILPG